jgi:ATP-dependent protease ClpP protease subunit
MHEIKIYGYITNDADKAEGGISLSDVQAQLALANGDDVKVRINSNGGDADEGFAIYNELRRYAKDNSASVHTFGESRLGSIATVIFLAGDQRELSKDLQPFVHMAYYDSDQEIPEAQETYLKELNERIAKHYEEHTELSFSEALELMEKETYIDTDIAKAMRFATSIEEVLRPVALKRFTTNINKNDDMDKPKRATLLAKAIKAIKEFAGAQNKILFTADERELDFYELAEDQEVTVGAKATYDGQPESGETYVFENGVLMEIREAAGDATAEDVAALEAEAALLAENLESALALVEEQATTIAAQAATIATFKAARSAAPAADDKRTPPKATKPESRAAQAAAKFKQTKQK